MTAEIIDQANELAEQRLQLTIQAHRLNRNAISAEHCIECGDPIDERRRAAVAGCQTCAECQSDLELRNKQRGI